MRGKQFAEAIRCFDAALAIDPEYWLAQLGKARGFAELGQFKPARDLAIGLIDKNLGSAQLHVELGMLLSRMRQFDKAILAYEKALALEPGNSDILFSLATLNRYCGKLDLAEEHVNKCLALNARDCEAQLFRSHLTTATPGANHVDELTALLSSNLPEHPGKSQLFYALAKEYEDLGQYDHSFESLQRGAQSRRRHMQYSVADDERAMQKIVDTYDRSKFHDLSGGHDTQAPIFIVGLPRSGSTLVERMLSSHADVSSIGEVNNFARALIDLVVQHDRNAARNKLELIDASTHINWRELGVNYIRSVEVLEIDTPRFIDKLPLNFLYAGLIRLALPNARIIHVVRHPMAVCYSIYKHWFKDAYPFSYDLTDMGRYYAAYARLMRHWHSVMPDSIIEVSYEQLVSDARKECRRLTEACGLPWDERCMEFVTNEAPVMTASAVQVRKPVFQSSVDSWRRVESQLSGLRSFLATENLV